MMGKTRRTNFIGSVGRRTPCDRETILGTTTAWVVAGLVCGSGLGLAARNTVRSLSSTVVEGSPWMYASVALFFFAVTLLAAFMPVRRACRLDPVAAVRSE